ncbi:MAG: 30S ribosomal protein S17 [Polyangiaceae bacterium]|nr:30S ribosomal protein S17 [Polyangiaceae bacterium]
MSESKTKPAAAKGAAKAKDTKASGPKSVPPKAAAKPAAKGGSKGKAPVSKGPKAPPVSARQSVPPGAAPAAPTEARKEHGFRRKIIGTVVGDKMAKTVVVEVIRKAMHPMYKKYVRVSNKYKAHDENNVYKVGDTVEIMEHRPISRDKRWLVTRLVSRPVEA